MKIERSAMMIKITTEEALDSLRSYQQDMIQELWAYYKSDHSDENYVSQSNFMCSLLDGTHTDWFQNLIEKYNIYWIDRPSGHVAKADMALLIERFPWIFFPGDILDEAEQNTLFFLDSYQLSTELILGRKL